MNGDLQPNTQGPPDGFKRDDRQDSIYGRLKRLVGPGPADFYNDACRHFAAKPPFSSSTHLIGHLMREIESALRDVLEPLADSAKLAAIDKNKKHDGAIRVILDALGIPESDPIAKAWLSMVGDNGLYSRAHRNNLETARPLDDEFVEFWAQFESVLSAVLDKFEGQYVKVFETIDVLAKKSNPTEGDVKLFLLHIPNDFLSRTRLFDQLSDPGWLPLLKDKGVFDEVPHPEQNIEERTTRYLPWPPANYLIKMAPLDGKAVAAILLAVKDNDNAIAKGNLLTIAANLPKEERESVVKKAKGWMKTNHPFYTADAAKKLMGRFADDGQIGPALEIAGTLLEILPDPRSQAGEGNKAAWFSPDPQTRLDDWQYGEFLKEDFQKLVALDPQKAHDLTVKLLLNFVNLKTGHYPDHHFDAS